MLILNKKVSSHCSAWLIVRHSDKWLPWKRTSLQIGIGISRAQFGPRVDSQCDIEWIEHDIILAYYKRKGVWTRSQGCENNISQPASVSSLPNAISEKKPFIQFRSEWKCNYLFIWSYYILYLANALLGGGLISIPICPDFWLRIDNDVYPRSLGERTSNNIPWWTLRWQLIFPLQCPHYLSWQCHIYYTDYTHIKCMYPAVLCTQISTKHSTA